jgi:hypothetical protein
MCEFNNDSVGAMFLLNSKIKQWISESLDKNFPNLGGDKIYNKK